MISIIITNISNFNIFLMTKMIMKKSDLFNVGYYLNKHESVRKDGMDVLLHYIYYGSKKGYNPSPLFNSEEYIKLNPDLKSLKINPLIHYLLYGKSENRKISTP